MNSSSRGNGLNASEKKTPPWIHITWINKLLGCIPLKAIWTKSVPPVPPSRCISKEESAGILSLVTFQWMSSLLSTGYKRSLELNDIWLLPRAKRVVTLEPKVVEALDRKVTGGAKRPLLWAIYETLKFEILLGGFCQLMASVLPVVNPFLLKYLVATTSDAFYAQVTGGRKENYALSQSIGVVLGMVSIQLIQCFCTNQALYRGMSVGGQSRGVLISLIFDKSMRLPRNPRRQARTRGHRTGDKQSNQLEEKLRGGRTSPAITIVSKMAALFRSKQKLLSHEQIEWNHGEIINLMSVHTYRVDQAAGMLHFIWTTPIAVLLGLILLILNISYSALAGFGFLVVAIPVLGIFIDIALRRRKNVNTLSDQRVTLTYEVLKYVRFLKYFAWESNFMDRIVYIRTKEIRAIRGLLATRNGIMAISSAMPVLATVISVTVLSVTGHTLEPASIFSSLAIFNSLRLPLNYLPLAIGLVVDGISSLSRIEEFLFLPEAKDKTQWEIEDTPFAIKTEDLSFCWEEPTSSNLGPVQDTNLNLQGPQLSAASFSPPSTSFSVVCGDLNIAKGELVAIIGLTGAGKTSLLEGLAGNMFKTSGNLRLNGKMAFCSQDIWIQNATIRENILFGQDYEVDWYRNVIGACCLENDFALFQHGDLTEIGERGVTCSGGQKQRISLARAIYRRPQIILLDDPLSAVDAKVGLHIMKEAICGLLNNSCRILATHQTWVLDKCDRILYVEKGKISTFNSYNISENETTMRALAVGIEENGQQPSEDFPELGEISYEPEQSHTAEFGSSGSPKNLMQDEERTQGSIPFRVYCGYARASGSYAIPILLLILLALAQTGAIMTGLWLSYWIEDKFVPLTKGSYIGIYFSLGVGQCLLNFTFSVFISYYGATASQKIFLKSFKKVLRAPMSFFDTTPLGRITNRFSKDIDTLDNMMTDSIRYFLITFTMIISVFILTSSFYPLFLAAFGPLAVIFIAAAQYYRASARDIKRYESVLRSNLYAKFLEALSGIPTIKSYGLQRRFSTNISEAIDDMNSAYFLTFANQRWLSMRFDIIASLLLLVTGALVATSRLSIPPSTGGLVLAYLLSISQMLTFSVRQLAEIDNHMNATERLFHYIDNLEEEAPFDGCSKVPNNWPQTGAISFKNVSMRYRQGLPLVLSNLNLSIQGGERIGIVGRTGAGKSSIMATLFRLVELSGGQMTVDGVNISTISLRKLRENLTIIPQDPILFRGTLRYNLDPLDSHKDADLEDAIRRAGLNYSTGVNGDLQRQWGLDTAIEEDGRNLSLGQRQHIALARAIVRQSQIILCDEATSNVDLQTDMQIQKATLECFAGKTVICIAHRLRTVLGYDRICVLDKGKVVELGRPIELFESGGLFRRMCEANNIDKTEFNFSR